MAQYDTIAPDWIRLKKRDGHLGALYHPQRRILRFVGREGTVDYNLAGLDKGEFVPTIVTIEDVEQA